MLSFSPRDVVNPSGSDADADADGGEGGGDGGTEGAHATDFFRDRSVEALLEALLARAAPSPALLDEARCRASAQPGDGCRCGLLLLSRT